MGHASAVAYLLFAVLVVFSLLELRWLKASRGPLL
jgi:ABC-type sugar transport system permease subunit